jgi:uncharacterized membrane protein
MKSIKRLVFFTIAAISAAAVIKELSMDEHDRTWHGDVLGIPYDFRPPTFERIKDAMWNPEDDRLFTPRPFGVGWSLNLARLLQMVQETSENASDDGA